jgi:Chitobiase/beta-hexosaminidase C-terminal domain
MICAAMTFFRAGRRSGTKVVLTLAVMALGLVIPSYGQTVFNCSSGFSSSGACGVSGVSGGGGGTPFAVVGTSSGTTPALSGSSVDLLTAGANHAALSMNYQTAPVNVEAFTAAFTFVPNGQNVSLIFNDTNNQTYFNGSSFSAGAGCEADFFQAFYSPAPGPPNNVFALEFDNYSPNVVSNPYTFNGSTAQIYSAGTSPCIPNDSGNTFPQINKVLTSPIQMNSPATTQNTSTGHTYSATVTYDGSNLTLNLFDVTAGGSCPGASCFTHTWTGVNIPSEVGGSTTAWVGLGGATGSLVPNSALYIKSFSYTEGSTTTQTAATPSFSPAAGTYSGSQNVALSSATSGAVICYNTTGSPATNGSTGCASGTRYAGPVTVSSNETMYAVAGAAGYDASPMASSQYVIQPPAATPPIFSPAVGTYSSAQTVTISDATSGATIYYTTNGTTPTTSSAVYSGPITVSSSETLEAIAVKSGDTNSAVASAAYTITPPTTVSTPTFNPPAGTYTSAQTVTISDATSGATIYYTTNGTTPTTSSAVYSGPITVSSSETLEAIAVKSGDTNSAVASAAYTMTRHHRNPRP